MKEIVGDCRKWDQYNISISGWRMVFCRHDVFSETVPGGIGLAELANDNHICLLQLDIIVVLYNLLCVFIA